MNSRAAEELAAMLNLELCRRLRKWTQTKCAEASGITQREWSDLERGMRPSTRLCNAVAHAFGVDPSEADWFFLDVPENVLPTQIRAQMRPLGAGGAPRALSMAEMFGEEK
jgi:transcriptional regulator with XRE-family HTH domain